MAKKQYLDLTGLTTYDGQIKAYIDGEIDAIPSDVMIITVTKVDSKYSTDKTYDEIKQAYDDGKALYVKYNDGYDALYELKTYDERNSYMTGFTFMNTKISSAGCTTKSIMIMSTGNVTVGNGEFTQEKIATVNTNSTLTTTSKTIVGAINELDSELASHTHDDLYYTESEIDAKLSTVNTSISNITSGTTPVKEAEHATSADSAITADSAAIANSAVTADSATKATQDGDENVIVDTYETKTDASAKLDEAKAYADSVSSSAANTVKNDLLNGAGAAYDTLKELGDLIDENVSAIDALEAVASSKADKDHAHEITDVTGLQAELDEISAKADESDVFYINVTGDENQALTADKTHAEIENAYKDGKLPCVIYDDSAFHLVDTYANNFIFAALINNSYNLIKFKGQSGIWMTKTEITLENGHTDFTTTSKSITGAIKELSSAKADIAHNHDDRYYTEAEVDGMIASKADASHNHAIADVTNLQSTLDGKAAASDLSSHTNNEDIHVTAAKKTNWDTAYTHSQADHAPVGAQANVIETIKVNGTALTPTSKAVNITVPTDYLVASDIANKADKATTLSGYGITNAYTKTEVDNKLSAKAAQSSLDAVSSVANEAKSAAATNTQAIASNVSAINAHTGRLTTLESLVGDGFEEITTAEIQALFAN